MKFKITYIFAAFTLILGLKMQAQQARPDLKDRDYGLSAQVLLPEQLMVFEDRAAQKIKDFFDYLAILSDPEMDRSLREEVVQEMTRIFVRQNAPLEFPADYMPKSCPEEMAKFMKFRLENGHPLKIQPLLIEKDSEFTPDGDFRFVMTFRFRMVPQPDLKPSNGIAHILLTKKVKKFGGDRKVVWEVFLDGIEAVN